MKPKGQDLKRLPVKEDNPFKYLEQEHAEKAAAIFTTIFILIVIALIAALMHKLIHG